MAKVIVFVGPVIHSTWENPLVVLEKAVLGVSDSKIVFLENIGEFEKLKKSYDIATIRTLLDCEFLIPGLIDTHVHAPQYPNAGVGLDLPLLEWLKKYTFPTEAKFADPAFAAKAYDIAVRRFLRNGTTTAFYHATIHADSDLILFDICDRLGQRAFVGKVCMDQESAEYQIEDTDQSIRETERFIIEAKTKNSRTVQPAVVPRFAVSCSKELLQGLGQLAKTHNVHIQSHLNECLPEIAFVAQLNPWSANYTDVYEKCGVLTDKSSMAHCVHNLPSELQVLQSHGTGVAHCPSSNTNLKSGLCDVRKLLDEGMKVGLGTDVSGGYSPSILDSLRQACQVSNVLGMNKGDYRSVDYKEAFRLATLGGSQVLGIDNLVGNFEVGKEFDALLISTKKDGSPIDVFEKDTLLDVIQKFIYLGDDRNISEVYVAGKRVVPFEIS